MLGDAVARNFIGDQHALEIHSFVLCLRGIMAVAGIGTGSNEQDTGRCEGIGYNAGI